MKRLFKIIVIGVCIGLLLAVVQNVFQIDEDLFQRGYWTIAVAVVLGAALFNVLYNIFYQRRMQKAATLLEAQKPREYIAEVEKMLQTAKGKNLRNILKINLTAGYIGLKEFDKAIDFLESISDRELAGSAVKTVYRLNLCTCYFNTAQGEKAMKLYKEGQNVFKVQRNGRLYGGNIAILDILAAIQSKQYDQAEQLLERAQPMWSGPRFQEAFQEMEHTLSEIKKENLS